MSEQQPEPQFRHVGAVAGPAAGQVSAPSRALSTGGSHAAASSTGSGSPAPSASVPAAVRPEPPAPVPDAPTHRSVPRVDGPTPPSGPARDGFAAWRDDAGARGEQDHPTLELPQRSRFGGGAVGMPDLAGFEWGIGAMVVVLAIGAAIKWWPTGSEPSAPSAAVAAAAVAPTRAPAAAGGGGSERVELVETLRPRVSASSHVPHKPGGTLVFTPDQAIDGDRRTAWQVRGVGRGSGDWLELDFGRDVTIEALELATGMQDPAHPKHGDLFRGNGRVTGVHVLIDSVRVASRPVEDRMGVQTLELPPTVGRRLRLVISDATDSSNFPDTALAEVRVLGRPR